MRQLTTVLFKLVLAFVPIILFALIYDSMRYYPNYLFGTIDTEGVYNLEKSLFGITTPDGLLIPSEYFRIHHCAVMDVLSGIFYLCWVPLPVFYGFVLFFTGQKRYCIQFTTTFLLVNLIGFVGYYVYPACPPWYVMEYGFEVNTDTPGNIGGFVNFDGIMNSTFGFTVFEHIYSKNANVFAAIPSLHSAYVPVALYFACHVKNNLPWIAVLTLVSIGIWVSAVYSGHHYIIDVVLGIITSVAGIVLYNKVLVRTGFVRRWQGRWELLVC